MYIEDKAYRLERKQAMGGIQGIIRDILGSIAARQLGGGFWTDAEGKLIEDYEDAWQDELGNPLCSYLRSEEEMEERYCGAESEEYQDTVSAGHIRDTAQRGGS